MPGVQRMGDAYRRSVEHSLVSPGSLNTSVVRRHAARARQASRQLRVRATYRQHVESRRSCTVSKQQTPLSLSTLSHLKAAQSSTVKCRARIRPVTRNSKRQLFYTLSARSRSRTIVYCDSPLAFSGFTMASNGSRQTTATRWQPSGARNVWR